MNNFHNSRFYYFIINHKYFLLLIVILSCMSLILYREYIIGGRLFLFEDFGSDSVRVSLPTYIYFFDWLRGGMPLWSDKMGIGTSVLSHGDIIFDPFTYILFIFGRNGIIYMFVYMVVAKIILSGIFFWAFLDKHKLSSYAKIIGAITYAFGGYMIVVGQNYVFGTIYVYMPLIFLGFEMWLQDRKKWLLILMLTLTALYFYYFFYMTAIFLGIYAIFRYFTMYSFRFKHLLTYILSLASYGLLSLGLSAFFWLPSLALTLNNLRIGSSVSTTGNMLLPNIKIILTALGRFFGYDTLGRLGSYVGYKGDYFQLALFSSVIALVLVPQIFCEEDKRKRYAYAIFSIALTFLLFIPFFAYAFNGFSDFTYRWTYILHFSLALFLAIAINNVYNKKKFSFKIFSTTLKVLLAVSVLVLVYVGINGNESSLLGSFEIFFVVYLSITIYILLIILFFRTRHKTVIKIAVLILVCSELVWFPSHFVNDRLTTNPDPVKNKLGYFDSTNKVVSYLKNLDSSIYRIDKSYDSVVSEYGNGNNTPSDNDAMVQGYRGLKGYNANNQPNYIRFLQNAGIFVKYPDFIPPKNARPQDSKYADFHYINGVGNRYLLQSFLGVKYYLTKTPFTLPDYYHYVTKIDGISIFKNDNYLPLGFTFDSFITYDEFMRLNNSEKDMALLSFVVTDDRNELSGIISKNNTSVLNNIISDTDISGVIHERRSNYLKVISYKEDDIVGQISVSRNKILVLTVPYDQGWTVSIDNHKVIPFKVDSGLIGIKLRPGSHIIELKYFPPKMMLGIIISIIALLLFILLMIYEKILLKGVSIINDLSMRFYNKYARKPCDELTKRIVGLFMRFKKPILKNLSIFSELYKLNLKKYIFYITTLFGILIFIFSGLITRGHSFYNLFSPDKKDYFMDFFNVLHGLFNGPYTYGSIYPSLPQLIYKILLRLVPYDIAGKSPSVIRATQSGEIVFLFYMLITLLIFFILLMEVKKGLKIEKYIFAFIILFSAPFLFQFERANIIFVALLFLMIFVFFKDSKNRIVREFALVSLAISGAIKFYPALFGLLLIKDRRYKDFFKISIYGLALFILPFFMVGGISQLPILVKNVFSTSDVTTNWGVGYAVNIQNTIRILFGFLGDFGKNSIIIARILSLVILVLGLVSAFFLRSKWKTVALLTLLMILTPVISYEYTLIFMLIPLIMFLDRKEKELLDYLYLACLILMFIPFTLGKIDSINNGFGHPALPLTYGILIQNIALSIMAIYLIREGLIVGKSKSIFISLRAYLLAFIIKIYGTKSKGVKGYMFIAGKILLTLLIILIFLGDNIFSAVYSNFKTTYSTYSMIETIKRQGYPYIFNIEPYYVHYGDKVVVRGMHFNRMSKNNTKLMSSYGEIKPERRSDKELIFSVPLHWKIGRIQIWAERPPIKHDNVYRASNIMEIRILDRLGNFNNDDIKYFGQIKYLNDEARDINNFKNYKLREYRFSRWIPTKVFQIYADIMEFKNKIKIIDK